MKSMEITAVGIDVSKRKSTVAIRRPGGVIVACPFDISHSSHVLEKLVSILKTTGGDIRVVMEHTSNYNPSSSRRRTKVLFIIPLFLLIKRLT